MQDRYLFKAKRKDDGEWVFGGLSYCEKTNAYFITNMGKDHISYIGFHQEVDSNTICQCTGLKDKNGRVIWENDIASYSDLITRDKKPICIEWNKMQASFVRKYRSPMGLQYLYLDEYIASRMEVIGNTFDSPELLEG